MSDTAQPGKWDHWIPRSFILFFVALAGLEIWFVSMATSTFSGLVTDQAYTTGLNYNEIIEQRRIEDELGWKATIDYIQEEGALKGKLVLRVLDRDGQPLAPDDIRATAEKMSRHPQIQAVDFNVQPDGTATADLDVPLAGRWFLRLRVGHGEDAIHLIREVDIAL